MTIDGETTKEVSFATKGNTSLSQVASDDSDRYSFKINFGKYIDDQTYHGLNKLNLNNIFADATDIVNCGIDAPLSGASESDRPMWAWITESDEYLKQYHETYDKLLSSYFESGNCQAEIERVRAMIAPYVQNDPTAFYTYDQFQTAVDTLEAFVKTRTESIRAQLDGALTTKTSEQEQSAKVDGTGIDISAMGTQSGGGRR